MIGHTQPRRLAARSVSQRIAEELKEPLGKSISFKVRFNEQGNQDSFVRLMTDGSLLAELAHDRYLTKYDTIIIDEAHERSLNIDFILGYVKNILPKRPDLKIIVTSATLDVNRFSQYFHDAPIFEVEGRSFPVEVRYRPISEMTIGGSDDDDTGGCFAGSESVLTSEGVKSSLSSLSSLPSLSSWPKYPHKSTNLVLLFSANHQCLA